MFVLNKMNLLVLLIEQHWKVLKFTNFFCILINSNNVHLNEFSTCESSYKCTLAYSLIPNNYHLTIHLVCKGFSVPSIKIQPPPPCNSPLVTDPHGPLQANYLPDGLQTANAPLAFTEAWKYNVWKLFSHDFQTHPKLKLSLHFDCIMKNYIDVRLTEALDSCT